MADDLVRTIERARTTLERHARHSQPSDPDWPTLWRHRAFSGHDQPLDAWLEHCQASLGQGYWLSLTDRWAPAHGIEASELLLELREQAGEHGALAGRLADALMPLAEDELASCVPATDAWYDTFALWCLTRAPRSLSELHVLAIAIGTRYGAIARRAGSVVVGRRGDGPVEPLVSASAQLAGALRGLSLYPSLMPWLVDFIAQSRSPGGGWADPGRKPDALTTLAAAELLSGIDPSFDPAMTVEFFCREQSAEGWWRADRLTATWLTCQVLDWLDAAERPFTERFRWPQPPRTSLDRKTRLPFYAYFSDMVRLIAELPGLSEADIELGFIDLAGFREFNNHHGQERGDAVLRIFADALAAIPQTMAIRDGGDEFLVLGPPTSTGLAGVMADFRAAWPGRFAAHFGTETDAVAPRVVVGRTSGRGLLMAREHLGRAIGGLKLSHGMPPPEGVQTHLGWLR